MPGIRKVGVIGSGTMGAGIAAALANCDTEVVLLDIVPERATERNVLVDGAIDRLLKSEPPALVHKSKVRLIKTGNLSDDIELLADCDWIIEAIIEEFEPKHDLYQMIEAVRKDDSIVSSNTSTLPLWDLTSDMPHRFQEDFIITHFFNPPRYMRLLEVVKGKETRDGVMERVIKFADQKLGKGVVVANDTPGFIANRIGIFWLVCGLMEAIKQDITVEEADYVIGSKFGIPKTAIFKLMDLVGVDLIPVIADQLLVYLPEDDAFRALYQRPKILQNMISHGHTGNKGKGGFYRSTQVGDGWLREVMSLQNGEYREQESHHHDSVEDSETLRELLEHGDKVSQYAWSVMSQTLVYAASLVPAIADDLYSVDKAMRLGYNWKMGPFEMIDAMGKGTEPGARWFANKLHEEKRVVPPILEKMATKDDGFYQKKPHALTKVYSLEGGYKLIPHEDLAGTIAERTQKKTPLASNPSARLWDLEDGICCLEFTTKMNVINRDVLEMMQEAVDIVKEGYKGLIVATDKPHFSAGADLQYVLNLADDKKWKDLESFIKEGQDSYKLLKYSPFPVVIAIHGYAVGGATELILHADGVQAHMESYVGLVETKIGGIPGWGGCKEMLNRWFHYKGKEIGNLADNIIYYDNIKNQQISEEMPAIHEAFELIYTARVSTSAVDAMEMLVITENDGITMNKKYVLAEAKQRCLHLANNYSPPEEATFLLPGKEAARELFPAMENIVDQQMASEHDKVIEHHLENVLSGGKTKPDKWIGEQHILDLEREAFVALIKEPKTIERIEYMLRNGKALRN